MQLETQVLNDAALTEVDCQICNRQNCAHGLGSRVTDLTFERDINHMTPKSLRVIVNAYGKGTSLVQGGRRTLWRNSMYIA